MRKGLVWVAVCAILLTTGVGIALAAKPTGGTVYVDDGNCAGLKPCVKTIQRGVNQVNTGGTVKVFPGTYDEVVEVDKDVTVEAYDPGDLPVVDGGYEAPVFTVTANGATIRTMHVTHGLGGVLVTADSVLVEDLEVADNTGDGILVQGASLDPVTADSVVDNDVSGNTGNGIHAVYTYGLTVTGNDASGNGGYGILIEETQNAQVVSNSVGGNTLGGIHFFHVDPSLIGSNQVIGNGGTGISVDSSQDITVSGNDVQQNNNDGIGFNEVDPSFISNNFISQNGGNGVTVDSSQEITVDGNDIQQNNNDGIGFNEVDPSFISNNDIDGNGGSGVYVSQSIDITVDGNDIQQNNNDGIGFNEVDPSFILDNNVANNGGNGVNLLNSLDILVRDNDVQGNAYGLRLHGGTGNFVYFNNFVGNTISAQVSGNPGVQFNTDCPTPLGNFWSDYSGGDDGTLGTLCGERRVAGDGVGDSQTGFLGLDFYPLMQPSGWDPYLARMRLPADLEPRTDDKGSKGNWVAVHIHVPTDSGYVARDINKNTLILAGNFGTIPWDPNAPFSYSNGPDGFTTLTVKFSRQAWVPIVMPGEWCYAILGAFKDGQTIMGVACIRVSDPP